MASSGLFYLFAAIGLISATMVIVANHPVHSVLFLVLAFVNATALLLLVEAEFIGIVFVLVYVGAIAVLFLFVVMMLQLKVLSSDGSWMRYAPVGGVLGVLFFAELLWALQGDLHMRALQPALISDGASGLAWESALDYETNLGTIGQLLYTHTGPAFLVSGLILLLAIIGAVLLTLRLRHGVKRQVISLQVGRGEGLFAPRIQD
jgi:NADH-quinone oxidoreductase subunit J